MDTDRRRPVQRAIATFLPLAVAVTGLAATVYLVAQQGLRSAADSPQVQLAEDGARALDAGTAPTVVTGTEAVDMGASLAPFVMVFDSGGQVLASSGRLDGADPQPPIGVLNHATSTGLDRVTWQPRDGVRIATVTVRWRGGTVLAGRLLREVERLEDQALLLVGIGWSVTMALSAIACLGASLFLDRLGDARQATHPVPPGT